MAQMAKMEVLVQAQSSADKLYDMFKNKLDLLPSISPQEFKHSEVVQGDGKSVGSIRQWTYVADGDTEHVKEMAEAVDDESKTVTYKMLEGNIMKYYKSFRSIVNVTGTGKKGSLVKWTIEFEKQNESIPDPVKYTAFLTNWTKNVDAYLIN